MTADTIRIQGLACTGPTSGQQTPVESAPESKPVGVIPLAPLSAGHSTTPLVDGLKSPPGCRVVSLSIPAVADSGSAVGPSIAPPRRSVFQVESMDELVIHAMIHTASTIGALVLEEVFEERAAAYDPGIGDLDDAVDDLFEVLDRDGLLVFATDVDAMIDDGRLARFVDDLLATEEHQGDLWQLALVHANGDETQAVRLLAVVLQDTSFKALLGHIDDPGLRSRTELAMQRVGRARRRFPEEVQVGGVIYHYYVIRDLAARLIEERDLSPAHAFAAAFLLNSEYELRSLSMRNGALGHAEGVRDTIDLLLAPIETLDVPDAAHHSYRNFQASMRDIYLGYAGAWRGAGLGGGLLDYGMFRGELIEGPDEFFRTLVAEAANASYDPTAP